MSDFHRIPNLPVTPATGAPDHIVERSDGPDAYWTFRFTVVGRRDFPYDMLRFDRCFPADGEAAAALSSNPDNRTATRSVKLVSRHPQRHWLPTFERWKSFGWFVTSTVWDERSDG